VRRFVEVFWDGEAFVGGTHEEIRDCYGLSTLNIMVKKEPLVMPTFSVTVTYMHSDQPSVEDVSLTFTPDAMGAVLASLPIYSRYVKVTLDIEAGLEVRAWVGATP